MTLPRPPISANTPIPNQPFSTPEVYYLEGNQGHLPLGQGLYIDPVTGDFTNVNPGYIYCTPQFSNLPVTYPPYGCETEVNTAGVTDFTYSWQFCDSITDFPCLDASSVTDFTETWEYCYSLTSLPNLDTSSGKTFYYTWYFCESLTAFPKLDFQEGENFYGAWSFTGLTSFPEVTFSKGEVFTEAWCACPDLSSFPALDLRLGKDFDFAWQNCTSLISFPTVKFRDALSFSYTWSGCSGLTTFPSGMFDSCSATFFVSAWNNCALSQQSVDNILVSLDTAGQSNGTVSINGGTSSAPGSAGLAAKASLQARGWTVLTN